MRGFRFRSILYSERCARICLASSQTSRPNIHVWTHFEPIFSLRIHGWIQTTLSQLAGVRGCRRTRQLSFFAIGCWLFIYWCREDVNKQFSSSRNRFLQRTPTRQDRFALRQLLWPEIFWLVDESNNKFARHRLLCVIGSEMNHPPSLK